LCNLDSRAHLRATVRTVRAPRAGDGRDVFLRKILSNIFKKYCNILQNVEKIVARTNIF
jgi:hypothetical protein